MEVYRRSGKSWLKLGALTALIAAVLLGLDGFACRALQPPPEEELVQVSGTFSHLETTVNSRRYSSHRLYWIYLEGQERAYCVDEYTGFSPERFPAATGDRVTLFCAAGESSSRVYGVSLNGETVLAYSRAAWAVRVRQGILFGGCALCLIFCWLSWVWNHRYTREKPAVYRNYRGRRFRR